MPIEPFFNSMKLESISAKVSLDPLFKFSVVLLDVVSDRVTILGVLGIDIISCWVVIVVVDTTGCNYLLLNRRLNATTFSCTWATGA